MKNHILSLTVTLSLIGIILISCENNKGIENNNIDIKTVPVEQIIGIGIKYSQGYLILNKKKYPNISYWKITPISNDDEKTLESIFLKKGKNYWKLDEHYYNGGYRFKIDAFDSSDNQILATSNLLSLDSDPNKPKSVDDNYLPYEIGCHWECEAPRWAWKIRQLQYHNGGSYRLELRGLWDYCDTIIVGNSEKIICYPHYYYLPVSVVENYICNQPNNTSRFPTGCPDPYYVTTTGILDANKHVYYSPTGGRLSGDIYGVIKDLGPWEGSFISTPRNNLLINDNACLMDRNAAMRQLNKYGDFNNNNQVYPELECISVFQGNAVGVGGGEPSGEITNCIGKLHEGATFMEAYDNYHNCMAENGWDIIHDQDIFDKITFINLNSPEINNFTIDISNSFNDKNEWTGGDFSMNESLYLMEILTKKGSRVKVIREFSALNSTTTIPK